VRLGAASCARPWVPRPARGPGCRVPRVPGCRVPRVPGCPALRASLGAAPCARPWVPSPARVPGCPALRASMGAASCARPWVPRPAHVYGCRVLRASLGAASCARPWVPHPARVLLRLGMLCCMHGWLLAVLKEIIWVTTLCVCSRIRLCWRLSSYAACGSRTVITYRPSTNGVHTLGRMTRLYPKHLCRILHH